MSDDEGDYGGYDDIGDEVGDEPADAELAGVESSSELAEGDAGEPGEEDGELGLDEDAAGSEDEESAEEPGEHAGDDEPPEAPAPEPAGPGPAHRAHPQRARADPLLRASNRHVVVKVVPPEERITDNRLHKSEAAYLLSMRAAQIAKDRTCFVDTGDMRDPGAMAYAELYARRCPLVLRRQVGTGPGGEPIVEDWNVREMALPPIPPPKEVGQAGRQ